jgi:hypothetical protein
MSRNDWMNDSVKDRNFSGGYGFYAVLYWAGVVLTLGCLLLVLAGNAPMFWRFEHSDVPLSWELGGLAVVAFLAAEFCFPAPTAPREAERVSGTEEVRAQLSPEWEAVRS